MEQVVKVEVSIGSCQASPGRLLVGGAEADTTLDRDYILYLHILGELNSEKAGKAGTILRERQLPDGGWNIFYGGHRGTKRNGEGSTWVGCGWRAIRRPRHISTAKKESISGRTRATNSYVRFYLAMAGAIDWDLVPQFLPELMLLPTGFRQTSTRCRRGRAES